MIAYVILAMLGASGLGMLIRLRGSLHRYQLTEPSEVGSAVPTVSVCIPARNEMHALADCLEKVLESTYPKLEVIVYDDESQDDTPTIIKSFAHDGVRFVGGDTLPDSWLGRNYALERLAREASGAFIVFMDVDTRIRPDTIGEIVKVMTSSNVDMLSVLPRREDVGRSSVWFGTLRYFWQLVGLSSARAAVSSSLWAVRRSVLLDRGGFEGQKTHVEPEADLATLLGNRYRYVAANMGVSFEKKWRSQINTSRRLLFLQYGISGLLALILLNLPTAFVAYGIIVGSGMLVGASILVWAIFACIYGMYLRVAWGRRGIMGALLWPYVVLQELAVMVMSLWGYVRGTVAWKQRTVRLR